MQCTCATLYCLLCPLLLYHIFPRYLTNGAVFWKSVPKRKRCVLMFFTTLSEIFLILRIIQRDIIINVQRSSCKFQLKLEGYLYICEKHSNIKSHENLSNGSRVLLRDGQIHTTKLSVAFSNFAKKKSLKKKVSLAFE